MPIKLYIKRFLSLTILFLMLISMIACNKTSPSQTGPSVNMPSIEDDGNDENSIAIKTPASQTEHDWFENALREYIQSELKIDNYYLSTTVFDTKGEINANNALIRASAMITLCVDSNTIDATKASDFSDNLAKKFAQDKATGEIQFSIYRIPHDTYIQITDANYNTAINESTGTDGFSKFSFNYGGTGDVILDSPEKPSTKPSDTPSNNSNENTPDENPSDDVSNIPSEDISSSSNEENAQESSSIESVE